MVMSWVWCMMLGISIVSSLITKQGSALSAAVLEGAQAGVRLAISIGGSLCLWAGFGCLMNHTGVTRFLSRLLQPLLHRLFPSSRQDPILSQDLSSNICANLLGLGNAATPPGIRAAKGLKRGNQATAELCRLIVLNTASIQLIPGNVAALRASLGSPTPFDILPAVWLTSFCSAGLGVAAAILAEKVWHT